MEDFKLPVPAIKDQQVMIAASYKDVVITHAVLEATLSQIEAPDVKEIITVMISRLGNTALSLEAWYKSSQTPQGMGG